MLVKRLTEDIVIVKIIPRSIEVMYLWAANILLHEEAKLLGPSGQVLCLFVSYSTTVSDKLNAILSSLTI